MRLLALALMGLVALPLHAQERVSAVDPQTVVDALQEAGYRAALTTDAVGDPLIESASGGIGWYVFFYDCTENALCTSIQFQTGLIMDEGDVVEPDLVTSWNRDFRFARAHLDADGDPILKYDLVLTPPGVEQAYFLESLEIWTDLVSSFAAHVDW